MLEETADPDDFTPRLKRAREKYFAEPGTKRSHRDPRQELPRESDPQVLADTFGTESGRLEQAQAMVRRGLRVKAKRLTLCERIGRRLNCLESLDHRFFRSYRCHCRYCIVCGPIWFRQKFSELLGSLEPVVKRLLHEGHKRGMEMVIAKLDITVPNTGAMPTPTAVRKFHKDCHRFRRAMERRFAIRPGDYGLLGCDEFGGNNTNLHRHCVYVGPKLPQSKARKELSALWSEIRGETSFVSIKWARDFRTALAHALKYPAKFLSVSTPERLAELEATFHRTRRFAACGAFYNVKREREPGDDSVAGECPVCRARLVEVIEPWASIASLQAEGRRDVDQVRREHNRKRIFLVPEGESP